MNFTTSRPILRTARLQIDDAVDVALAELRSQFPGSDSWVLNVAVREAVYALADRLSEHGDLPRSWRLVCEEGDPRMIARDGEMDALCRILESEKSQ